MVAQTLTESPSTSVVATMPPPASPERPVAARSGPVAYRDGDADVVPPVPVKQTVPQWVCRRDHPTLANRRRVEVTIDESGDVLNAILRKPLHPSYDPQLIKAALAWKYEPARKAGVPVRFVKWSPFVSGARTEIRGAWP